MSFRSRSIVVIVLAACALAAPAAAQNRCSFIDAAKSPLDFSRATVKPQLACREVRSLTAYRGAGSVDEAASFACAEPR